MIAAGIRFPVFASLATAISPISSTDIAALSRRKLPFVLLVPSLGSITTGALAVANAQNGRVLIFEECLLFAPSPGDGLVPSQPAAALFASEIATLGAGQATKIGPVMPLPADADWPMLTVTFIADEVVSIRYGSHAPRRIEPDDLGMKDRKTGKAARQWRLLQICAALNGALPRTLPVQTVGGKRVSSNLIRTLADVQRGYERQRQLMAASLKARFGIDQEPFSLESDCLRARFLIDASGLRQGRADQRDRNFGDDD